MRSLSWDWRQRRFGGRGHGGPELPTYARGRATSRELTRLLCAAVVSRGFAAKLLSDPARALDEGYLGERFLLTPAEYATVMAIHASTVPEFAASLVARSLVSPVDLADSIDPGYGSSEIMQPQWP